MAVLTASTLAAACGGAPGDDGAMELPTPRPASTDGERPPPAWLIVGDKATVATYGSYCYGTMCVDMVPAQMMPELATATVPADEQVVIRVGTGKIKEFSVSVSEWTDEPAPMEGGRKLDAQGQQQEEATIFTLEPIGDSGDMLLTAHAKFEQGDASYLWRLNPSE